MDESRPDDAGTPGPKAPTPAAPAPRPRRRVWRWLLAAAAVPLLVAAAALGLLGTEGGTRWLLGQMPGLAVQEVRGALLTDGFALGELRWSGGPGQPSVRVAGLRAQRARWEAPARPGAWLAWHIGELSADRVEVDTGPPSDARLTPPASLTLPIGIEVEQLRIGVLQIDRQPPVQSLVASLSLGPQTHRVELQALRWQDIALKGQARIATTSPFALDLRLQAAADTEPGWDAQASAQGPLSSFDVRLSLAGRPAGAVAPPALDAQAQIRPFEAWPLGIVSASTRDLDLAALAPGAPHTRLTGRARLLSRGLREPLDLSIALDNAAPGRLDESALPVYALRLDLKADPRQPDRLTIGPFEIEAADARGAAGRWSGDGIWSGTTLTLRTRLTDLQPARLDSRLATMRLSGPLEATVEGLPHPDPRTAAAPWGGWKTLALALQGELSGHVSGAPEPVSLALEGRADAQGLDLRRFHASSGAARLDWRARVQRADASRWRVSSTGELAAFDPLTWFPGPETARFGRGPHRLNGGWTVDVDMPERLVGTPWAEWLPRLRGRADLRITDSRLAGLPFGGELQLRQEDGSSAGQRSRARAEWRLGGTVLTLDGAGDPLGDGRSDRTQLRASAPSLAELAPLLQTWPGLQDWVPRQGELQLTADVRGRWPALSGEVQASGSSVRLGALSLAGAKLSGRFDRQRDDELSLDLTVSGLAWSGGQLDSARAELRGTPASHRFEAQLAAPLEPPAALAQALAWRTGQGAVAQLSGTGSWSGTPAQGGRWTGQIDRLSLGGRESLSSPGNDGSWFEARQLQGEWSWQAAEGTARASLQPGSARSGALAWRWQELQWQTRPGTADEWRVSGEFEPLAVGPLLQRAQRALPGALQWSGDLRLGARFDLRAASRFEADIRIARESGDLSFSDGAQPQPLGLTQTELQLQVRDGLWRLTPRLQGRMLGRLDGEVVARAQPAERWPSPRAALDGQLQAQVASLTAWSGWLPPGWRMQGALDLQARLSGTLGAPAYTGFVEGRQIGLRNLLQGVDLQDGTLAVRLEGETARVETLQIRGGEGRLSAEGEARFGAQPSLQLSARAERLRVLGRVDRQLVLSGQSSLVAGPDRLRIEGRITADSGLFDLSRRDAPSLDEDVDVQRPGAAAVADASRREPSPLLRQTQMLLDVDLGSQLRLRGRGLDTGLTGTLKLSAPGGRLAIQGSVRADGGTYAAYGQKLEIERGVVSFSGPPDRARLDILALRPNLDIRAGVAITGPALDPRVRLYSEPEMAETDKLSWLVLGRGPEGLGRTDTALLQRAAMALLAGEGGGPTDGVLRKLGLDDFSIRQSDGDVKDTVVSVGKQLSRRWYVGYERGVNATTGTWQLIYRAAQRFTLRAQSGQDNSLDLIWTWRFGGPRKTD